MNMLKIWEVLQLKEMFAPEQKHHKKRQMHTIISYEYKCKKCSMKASNI